MNIVINKCYGGYGLSHEGCMKYADLSGFKLYPFVDKRAADGSMISFGEKDRFKPYTNQEKVFIIHYSTKPLTGDGTYEEDTFWSDDDIKRDDPLLIKVVKELGKKSWGSHANLEIIEIPDGIKWAIEEYDGIEWIAEKHRTWE